MVEREPYETVDGAQSTDQSAGRGSRGAETPGRPGTERSTRRRNCALIATITVLSDMSSAPTAGERRIPIGALLMSLSTVIVAINAQFLRRVDLSVPGLPGVSAPREPRPAD